jgi:hypothetical protein
VTSARGLLRLPALLALCAVLAPAPARAHGRSTSTSSWEIEPGGARVTARVQWSDLQLALPELAGLPPPGDARAAAAVDAYLVEHVALHAGGERCPALGPPAPVPSADPTHVARAWRVRCARPGAPELRIDAFLEVAPSHLHLARVTLPDGVVRERVFVLDDTVFALAPVAEDAGAGPRASDFRDYLSLGVEHITTGLDHLTFLLALLLIGVSFAEMATIVTGFTVAHSLTLGLGVLGVIQPQASAIEALIGLSIAVVALENFALTTGAATRRLVIAALGAAIAAAALGAALGPVSVPALALLGVGLFSVSYLLLLGHVDDPARLRWLVALVFGLVHGFGFAGLLVEIGLPARRLVPALLGFNLGVELGQLAIVAVAWPLWRAVLRRHAPRRALLVQLGSAPALVAGIFWFLTRVLAR